MSSPASRSAFVVGGSGAVGRRLVEVLLASRQFSRVVLMGRSTIEGLPQNDVIEQKIVDFENMDKHSEDFAGLDVGFCTLGTTRAKAGAKGFYKVDHDYVVDTAKVAKEKGVKEFVMVTAVGANENSFMLYSKTKGEVERDVSAIGFEKTLIVRPAFLEGPRNEFRLMESVGRLLITPIKFFSNSIAISTEDVAKAMVVGSLCSELKGKVIWENAELKKKAAEWKGSEEQKQQSPAE